MWCCRPKAKVERYEADFVSQGHGHDSSAIVVRATALHHARALSPTQSYREAVDSRNSSSGGGGDTANCSHGPPPFVHADETRSTSACSTDTTSFSSNPVQQQHPAMALLGKQPITTVGTDTVAHQGAHAQACTVLNHLAFHKCRQDLQAAEPLHWKQDLLAGLKAEKIAELLPNDCVPAAVQRSCLSLYVCMCVCVHVCVCVCMCVCVCVCS